MFAVVLAAWSAHNPITLVSYRARGNRPLEPVIFRPVVAFLLIYQAAFKMLFGSFILGLFRLRCTSVIGSQFRVLPDQRVGLA